MRISIPINRRRKAFTLLEVVIASMIVFIAALGVVSGITYGKFFQQYQRERSAANRAASAALEEARRLSFGVLRPRQQSVLLDGRGTLTATDDVRGTMTLVLFDRNGTSISVPPTTGLEMITAAAAVQWTPAGQRGREARPRFVAIQTYLVP